MKDFEGAKIYEKDSITILPINKTQRYAWGSKDKASRVGMMT